MVVSPLPCSTPLQTQTGGRKFWERSRPWNPARAAALGDRRVLGRTACESAVALPTRAGAESVTRRHNEPRARVIRRGTFFAAAVSDQNGQQGDHEIKRSDKTHSVFVLLIF